MSQICGIGKTSVNVVFRQLRIMSDDIRFRHAFGEAVQNYRDLDAGVANAWPAAAYVGFGSNFISLRSIKSSSSKTKQSS